MTQLTLQIDNPSILSHLQAVLRAIKGVKVLGLTNTDATTIDENPNAETIAAMKEARSGKDAGVVCMDSLESFMNSMK